MVRKLVETISEKELGQIVQATKKPHHKTAFILGFYECMRISEVVKVGPDNFDWGQKLLRIKEGKGKKDRNVPIMPQVKKRCIDGIVPIKCGIRALEMKIKQLGRDVLNKDVHFHTLRHSGATWLLNDKKWDVRHVQQFLGHSRLDTTQLYTHVSPQHLIDLAWQGEKSP